MHLRRLVLVLALLAFLAATVLYVGTREIPLIREWVTATASEKLALDVEIRGRIGLELLPRPGIVARGVRIATREGAPEQLSATLGLVAVDIDPIEWLKTRVPRITKVAIRNAKIGVKGDPVDLVESLSRRGASDARAINPGPGTAAGLAALWVLPDLGLSKIELHWEPEPGTERELSLRWATLEGSQPRRLRMSLASKLGTTPVSVYTELARGPSGELKLEGLLAHLGENDLYGSGTLSADRGLLKANFSSQHLRLFEVPDPQAPPPESAAKLLDFPLPLELAPDLHAELGFDLAHLEIAKFAVEKLRATLSFKADELRFDLESATLLNGQLRGVATIRRAPAPARFGLKFSVDHLEMSQLGHQLAQKDDGKLDFEVDLQSEGRTLRELLDELEGTAMLAAGAISSPDGRIGLLGRSVFSLYFSDDKEKGASRLNCGVLRSNFSGGIGTTQGLIDTENATLAIHGFLNLREFSVDGVIKPVPKRKGLGGLSTPFQIYGPIMHPEIESDRLRLAAETGKLLALGFLNPALMIVPFVDLGTDGNPCEGALASRLRESLAPHGLVSRMEGEARGVAGDLKSHTDP